MCGRGNEWVLSEKQQERLQAVKIKCLKTIVEARRIKKLMKNNEDIKKPGNPINEWCHGG